MLIVSAVPIPKPFRRYSGPLEYLTMWMCLFLSPAVQERMQNLQACGGEPDWTRLRVVRVRLSALRSIHPHVLDVLQVMGSTPERTPRIAAESSACPPSDRQMDAEF